MVGEEALWLLPSVESILAGMIRSGKLNLVERPRLPDWRGGAGSASIPKLPNMGWRGAGCMAASGEESMAMIDGVKPISD
jgi:hypothetical protein